MPLKPRDFHERMWDLYQVAHADHGNAYDGLIYMMAHPIQKEFLSIASTFRRPGARPTAFDQAAADRVDKALIGLKYPDLTPLHDWVDIPGMDFHTAVSLLHGHQPSYPLLDPTAAKGLEELGQSVEVPREPDEEAWGHYLDYVRAVDQHKVEVPHWCVPESHFYLARLIEGALWGLGHGGQVDAEDTEATRFPHHR